MLLPIRVRIQILAIFQRLKKFQKRVPTFVLIFNDIINLKTYFCHDHKNIQVGFGSGYIIQAYGSKDPYPKENKYGSATLVFRVEITTSKHL
jgi:hypothetical protein